MDDWREKAACKQADPNLFYPDSQDKSSNSEIYAKNFCRKCEVAAECLMAAINQEEIYGIWGSFSPKERNILLNLFSKESIDIDLCKSVVNVEIKSIKAKILRNELGVK